MTICSGQDLTEILLGEPGGGNADGFAKDSNG
jgi:hypothetical protein